MSFGLSAVAVETVLLYLTNKFPDVERTIYPIVKSLGKIQVLPVIEDVLCYRNDVTVSIRKKRVCSFAAH